MSIPTAGLELMTPLNLYITLRIDGFSMPSLTIYEHSISLPLFRFAILMGCLIFDV